MKAQSPKPLTLNPMPKETKPEALNPQNGILGMNQTLHPLNPEKTMRNPRNERVVQKAVRLGQRLQARRARQPRRRGRARLLSAPLTGFVKVLSSARVL